MNRRARRGELFPALQAGARGYLTKDASAEETEHASVVTTPATRASLPDDLATRELEVLKLIATGFSNAEIAQALVVSGATAKTHTDDRLACA